MRDKLTAYASPEYGPLAFGTSARSQFETDWPAGGFIGIHGTDQPGLIPGHISHGCIRLRNAAILRLGKLMPVGTPVTIRVSRRAFTAAVATAIATATLRRPRPHPPPPRPRRR